MKEEVLTWEDIKDLRVRMFASRVLDKVHEVRSLDGSVEIVIKSASQEERIEPERIEVGDTVDVNDKERSLHGKDKKVVAVSTTHACVMQGDCMDIVGLEHLTLIRKGERHVFEGVEWKEDGEGGLFYPVAKQLRQKLKPFVGGGKTYRMTLEEMPKIGTERGWIDA